MYKIQYGQEVEVNVRIVETNNAISSETLDVVVDVTGLSSNQIRNGE